MPALGRRDGLYVLDIGDDENRFSPAWLDEMDDALSQVAAAPAPLVTAGTGKFYTNGLDLEYLLAHPDDIPAYTRRVEALLARLLTLPVPTAAAVNGHAFGAGAMLAIAHDWRVMRADRGYFCFPEVDISIPFTPGMAALIQAKVTPQTAVSSMTTGRRFGGPDAADAGLVDATAAEGEVLGRAIAMVAGLAGKSAPTLGQIKATMFAGAAQALRANTPA